MHPGPEHAGMMSRDADPDEGDGDDDHEAQRRSACQRSLARAELAVGGFRGPSAMRPRSSPSGSLCTNRVDASAAVARGLTAAASPLDKFQIILNTSIPGQPPPSPSCARPPPSSARAEAGAARLAQVHALLGDDLAAVDAELARLAREGLSPATDSAAHLLEAGGKRVRPLTVLLSAACFGAGARGGARRRRGGRARAPGDAAPRRRDRRRAGAPRPARRRGASGATR